MQIDHSDLPRGQGIGFGDTDRHRLVKGENVVELRVGLDSIEQWGFGGARIAGQKGDTTRDQVLQEEIYAAIFSHPRPDLGRQSLAVGCFT
jgi:hypothetical protein